jgi:hypothetical protein
MSDNEPKYEVEDYAGHEVQELVGVPVPTFLKWVYAILPIWGLIWLWFYWDGTQGALDRGSWQELQQAANTTFQRTVIKSE